MRCPGTQAGLGGVTAAHTERASSSAVYWGVWAVAFIVRATGTTAEFSIVCAEEGEVIVT